MKLVYAYLIVLFVVIVGGGLYLYKEHQAAYDWVEAPATDNQNPDSDTSLTMYTDPQSGVTFGYPSVMPERYVTEADWPPIFTYSPEVIACQSTSDSTSTPGYTSTTTLINGHEYCLSEQTEGAAGSVYHTYRVGYEKDGGYLLFSFSLRYVQCLNYDMPESEVCQAEQDSFDINTLIDMIAQSATHP